MGLLVLNPGASTTIQDEGRRGYREWGVPLGGSFDRASAAIANALLGNTPDCAVLELTLLGGTYLARVPMALALAGAPMAARLVLPDGHDRTLVLPLAFAVRPGDRLVLGSPASGARTYLAVRGGWQTPVLLGSRSSESRIEADAFLFARPGTTRVRHPRAEAWRSPTAEPLRIVEGPDGRVGFDHGVWERADWRVGAQSNRMGLRLEGPPIALVEQPDRFSAPVAPGAIQLAGRAPIVLGVACGTMGGYPHVAQVISADLDRLGQVRPGDRIRFRRVSLEEARRADREGRAALAARIRCLSALAEDGHEPLSPV